MSIEANPENDLISNESPMGQAVFGRSKDETISFDTPDGKKKMKILGIRR
jgi:transcription elongation GreA/GreB family factor